MPTLPASASFTGSTVTEAQFKTAITDMREFLAGLLGTAGTQAAALSALGAALNGVLSKAAAYPVVAADRGKLIDYTAAPYTVTLPTVGGSISAGFVLGIRNSAASGALTVGRNAANIDGAAADLTLNPGESCLIVCDGTGWKTAAKTLNPTVVVDEIDSYTSAAQNTVVGHAAGTKTGITTYNKVVEFRASKGGSLSVRLGLSDSSSLSITVYARIYVNGTAVGTERTASTGTRVYWNEVITLAAGDLLQLYVKGAGASGIADYTFAAWTGLTTKFVTLGVQQANLG